MKSGKRHLIDEMELKNQDKIRTLGEKEIYKYLGILVADTIKQMERKELKSVSQKNRKTTRNHAIYQEPYKRVKYLGSPPRKIFETILEVDQRRT